MTVYSLGKQKVGNTTMTSVCVWPVTIVEIDHDKETVIASWNCNKPQKFYPHSWSKWRLKKPVMVSCGFGRNRLATREEIKSLAEMMK